jgi:nitroreductase
MIGWLSREDFDAAVRVAVQAPSMHNTQPWRFHQTDGAIELSLDAGRQLPVADASGWASRVGCGAALFNLRLALAVRGTPGRVALTPDADNPDLLARITMGAHRAPLPSELRLFHAIALRHSNRMPFIDKPVPVDIRAALTAAATAENADLELFSRPAAVEQIVDLLHTAHRALEREPAYRDELAAWSRAGVGASDGVARSAGGPAPAPDELLPRRDFGGRELAGLLDYGWDPLLAVLSTVGDWHADQVNAGQALQRVLLTAADLGVSASLFSQPIEVRPVRDQLRLVLAHRQEPQMLMRFGYAVPAPRSPRRPVADVIDT